MGLQAPKATATSAEGRNPATYGSMKKQQIAPSKPSGSSHTPTKGRRIAAYFWIAPNLGSAAELGSADALGILILFNLWALRAQSPGSPRGGDPRKMGKNYEIPLPVQPPKKGKNYRKNDKKCIFGVFFVIFR